MSKLFKQNCNAGQMRRPFAGDVIRTDHVRSYITSPEASVRDICSPESNRSPNPSINSAVSQVSAVRGNAPLACYDTDTLNSSLGSASLHCDELPPPPSQWIQSLEEARVRGSQPVTGGVPEPYYENTFTGYNEQNCTSGPIYENQQIIDQLSQRSSSSSQPMYENINSNGVPVEYRAANSNSNNIQDLSGSSRSRNSGYPRSTVESARLSQGYEDPWDQELGSTGHVDDGSGWFRESRQNDTMCGSLQLSDHHSSMTSNVDCSTRGMMSSYCHGVNRCSAGEMSGAQMSSAQMSSAGIMSQSFIHPHESDTRNGEGYERPWDLRPHQKDERPGGEYDRPWDERLKDVESNLAAAKITVDAAKSGPVRAERCQSMSESFVSMPDCRGQEGYEKPWDLKPHQRDDRPTSEYERAWDGRLRNLEGGSHPREVSGGVERRSARNSTSGSGMEEMERNSNVERRVNSDSQNRSYRLSTGSLDEQSWFHGFIGRTDAELVMQGTPEGSFLVRRSEVNAVGFSLTIKSQNGFIHLKIVVDGEGRFILGQFSKPFNSISQMLRYYSVNKLPIKGAEHISLTYPIPHDIL